MVSPVLVLGGSGDIGSAISRRFSAAGHEVTSLGREAMDLSKPETIERWFAVPRPAFNVLIHSASMNNPKSFTESTQEEIDACFDVNVNGFLRVVRHLIPGLKKTCGRIVIIGSIFSFLAREGRLPYAMSKHALLGVVKTLALELAADGVLVNAVSPGYIDTKLTRQNNNAATIEKLAARIPLQCLGSEEGIAEAVYFLSSAQNSYITGQNLVIDGGFSINGGP